MDRFCFISYSVFSAQHIVSHIQFQEQKIIAKCQCLPEFEIMRIFATETFQARLSLFTKHLFGISVSEPCAISDCEFVHFFFSY